MKKEKMKTVLVPFRAPIWSKWMAFDADGCFCVYNIKPVEDMECDIWLSKHFGIIFDLLFQIVVPENCSNPDWWIHTLRRVDRHGDVIYVPVKAPAWARWMAFDSTGELCFYDGRPYLHNPYLNGYGYGEWDYDENAEISDLKIRVHDDVQDKDWWKGTLRKV
jgi:hypothetical protein